MPKSKQWFEWTLKIKVHKTWVEDGFDFANNQEAKDRIAKILPYAWNDEFSVKVISKPNRKDIRKVQGYND